jgi:AcrR family transcriptional regulator
MSHEKGDLRVRRTDKLIQEALVELIIEKGFDTITVGEIAERAMVNRATFYRHYEDKYDLVEKIFAQALDEFVAAVGPPRNILPKIDPRNASEQWEKLFDHFAEHKRLYQAMLGRNGSPWFANRMRDQFASLMVEREELRQRLPAPKGGRAQPLMPTEVAIVFTANLFLSTIAWWLESGKGYTSRQMVTWLLDVLVHGYVRALSPYVPSVVDSEA